MEKNEKMETLKLWLQSGASSFDEEKSNLLISKLHDMSDSQLDAIYNIYKENSDNQQDAEKTVDQTNNAMESEIYKRKLSVSEILAIAWDTYFKNFNTFVLLILVTYIPVKILNIIFSVYVLNNKPIESIKDYTPEVIAYNIIIYLITVVLLSIATISITFIVQKDINNQDITFAQAVNKAFNKLPSYILTGLMLGIFLALLFLLLIIPGIIFSVFWVFALTAVILKNQSGMKALEYSKNMVEGRWWQVANYALWFGLIAFVAILFISLIFVIVSLALGKSIILDFVLLSFEYLITVYFSVVYVVFFINFDATKKPLS